METRRTKIVATIGPASRAPETLAALISAGVDVVRLNFAHDDPAVHEQTAARVREAARRAGRVVGVLVDLPGPKMRSGPVKGDEVVLQAGRRFVLTSEEVVGDEHRVSTTVPELARMVSPGAEIFLADGEIVLRVEDTADGEVVTSVVRGGLLRSRKGMHVPTAERAVEAFTPEDEKALEHALRMKAELVGLSFVRDGEDLRRAREALPKRGHRPMLVAKIETASACDRLDEIVGEADAVMVARGDLGIQKPLDEVPLLQKRIIRACNRRGVPVITATEMLESMTSAPLPTRAEATDVANAVLDGTDALMLSEETAVGSYPVETVATMARLAATAERESAREVEPEDPALDRDRVSWAVAHAAVAAAEDLAVRAILCPTRTGSTARRVSAFRPSMPIIGLSSRPATLGGMALSWGVTPLPTEDLPEARDMRDEVDRAVGAALGAGLIQLGDLVTVVAGSPGPRAGRTDFMRVVRA